METGRNLQEAGLILPFQPLNPSMVQPREPTWLSQASVWGGGLQGERPGGNKSRLFTGCRTLGMRPPAEQHPGSSDYRDTTWVHAGLIMKGVNHRQGETGTLLRFITHTV